MPCKSCEKVIFDVWEGNKKNKLPIQLVKVGKKSCVKNLLGDADNFSVPFPKGSDFKSRALLIAAALLIDYRMFENDGGADEVVA